MGKRRGPTPEQLHLKEPPAEPPPGRGPIVLELGPRNFAIARWLRDEKDVPLYSIVRKDVKAASIAATLARQEGQHG